MQPCRSFISWKNRLDLYAKTWLDLHAMNKLMWHMVPTWSFNYGRPASLSFKSTVVDYLRNISALLLCSDSNNDVPPWPSAERIHGPNAGRCASICNFSACNYWPFIYAEPKVPPLFLYGQTYPWQYFWLQLLISWLYLDVGLYVWVFSVLIIKSASGLDLYNLKNEKGNWVVAGKKGTVFI